MLRTVGTHVFLSEGSIPKLNFVSELIVDAEENEKDHNNSEESSDIRQSIVKLLEAPFNLEQISSFPKINLCICGRSCSLINRIYCRFRLSLRKYSFLGYRTFPRKYRIICLYCIFCKEKIRLYT